MPRLRGAVKVKVEAALDAVDDRSTRGQADDASNTEAGDVVHRPGLQEQPEAAEVGGGGGYLNSGIHSLLLLKSAPRVLDDVVVQGTVGV